MRSEQEMAAQVVARLIVEGVIPTARRPDVVARIADVVKVPVPAIRDAWRLLEARPYRRPTDRPVEPRSAVPVPEPGADRFTASSRQTAAWKRAHPEPGKRRCARCAEVKDEADFPIKDRATGERRSYCDPCWRERQRERYVTVERERVLNAVGITLTLTEADNVAGLACSDCGAPLVAGDEVHGARVSLAHVDCDAAVLARPAEAS